MSLLATLSFTAACGSTGDKTPTTDAEFKAALPQEMHDSIEGDLEDLQAAARALQAAAPTPSGRGWDATLDADALTAMKAAWRNCRIAYEHVEGATAPVYPDLDVSMDYRYDDFLSTPPAGGGVGTAGDADPFDGTGITGMHAIERILYSNIMPAAVVTFEATLTGNSPSRFPATAVEAMEFKTGLAQRLVDDADKLQAEWVPSAIDVGAAFQGLVGLMNEQKDKIDKASTETEESRYAQLTLFDLRNNLEGTKTIYGLFQTWVTANGASGKPLHDGGAADDAAIEAGFATLGGLYAADAGDALPAVPADWSSDMPTTADRQTPFGVLWVAVHAAVNPDASGSVVSQMNDVAVALGLPEFTE